MPNLVEDERFQNAPFVLEGGLRAYAGIQLRCSVQDGTDVALGSLCVSSEAVNQHLTQAQLDIMTKFADMLTEDLLNASRQRRARQQARNDDLIKSAMSRLPENLDEDAVLAILREVFVGAQVQVRHVLQETIQLEDDETTIPCGHSTSYWIWEDQNTINDFILTRNHEAQKTVQHAVRAIISDIKNDSERSALVVATRDIDHIYDDVDVRFVRSCTLLLSSIAKEKSLQRALTVKEQFMRGVTHHLRTPIHGILSCVELLESHLVANNPKDAQVDVSENIEMIKDSGKELMRFVNSMIRYNDWMPAASLSAAARVIDMDSLEAMILEDIPWATNKAHVSQTCVYFERQTTDDVGLVLEDESLIRDCLQPLVLNALQNTTEGSIIITYSVSAEFATATFDIRDSGCGIAPLHQQRIFDSYEKVGDCEKGSGLGLTLARKAAQALNGTVMLISSDADTGSHFRVTMQGCVFACPLDRMPLRSALEHLPDRFYLVPASPLSTMVAAFARHLEAHGIARAAAPDGALVIVTYTHRADEFDKRLAQAVHARLCVSLVPNQADTTAAQAKYPSVLFSKCPFTARTLANLITSINDACARPQAEVMGKVHRPTLKTKKSFSRLSRSLIRRDSSMPHPRAMQCLVVDDNIINLRILSLFCEQRSFPYRKALDGLQAIEQYKDAVTSVPVALILLDLQMPKCDGIEACKAIRDFEKEQEIIPALVFIVTSQDSPKDRQKALEAGADDYFVKPLDLKKLDAILRRHFTLSPGEEMEEVEELLPSR